MKQKENELDVDFIGGEGPLTKEEEKLLNDYLRRQKVNKSKPSKIIKEKRLDNKKID